MKTTLITGASGGLGEEFARLAAAEYSNLVLVARSKGKLDALAEELMKQYNIQATVLAHDLSADNAVHTLVRELEEKNSIIDTLINNAGFGAFGSFAETAYDQEKSLIDVNITALTTLTKLLLPSMVQRGNGRILNVASTAAFLPGPFMAVYYASKAYVLNFSLALSVELEGTGVTVTCLCPGPTKTDFAKNAHMGSSKLFQRKLMKSKTVALIGYRAMKRGKPLIIAGWVNTLGVFIMRFLPRMTGARIAQKIQSPV
jgi:short-subunit dehydrogenase